MVSVTLVALNELPMWHDEESHDAIIDEPSRKGSPFYHARLSRDITKAHYLLHTRIMFIVYAIIVYAIWIDCDTMCTMHLVLGEPQHVIPQCVWSKLTFCSLESGLRLWLLLCWVRENILIHVHPGLIILFPSCYLWLAYMIIGSFINCHWFPLMGAGVRLHIMALGWSDSEYGGCSCTSIRYRI